MLDRSLFRSDTPIHKLEISILQIIRNNTSLIKWIIFILFSLQLTLSSWLNDDIMLTLRTVLNFINGHGLVFNIGERVQAYTHPLWFFILSGAIFTTQEVFYTTLLTNSFFSVVSIFIIIKAYGIHRLPLSLYLLFFVFLTLSVCFIDYTSSGLENGLGFFLFSLLFYYINKNKWIFIPIISGFLFLTRMDYVILIAPFLIYYAFFKKDLLKNKILSLSTFISITFGWLIFSLVYYGSLFPNTYYAKTLFNIPSSIKNLNAGNYYKVFFQTDIFSASYIILFFVFILYSYYKRGMTESQYSSKEVKTRELLTSISVSLYLLYILSIGGGYLMGRFLSIPVFIILPQLFIVFSRFCIKIGERINNTILFSCLSCTFLIIIMFAPYYYGHSIKRFLLYTYDTKEFFYNSPLLFTDSDIVDSKFTFYDHRSLLFPHIQEEINRGIKNHKDTNSQWITYTEYLYEPFDRYFYKKNIDIVYITEKYELPIKKEAPSRYSQHIQAFFGSASITCGSTCFIIDNFSLTDPLLSRIQSQDNQVENQFLGLKKPGKYNPKKISTRTAHFVKKIPKGYIESIKTGENKICQPELRDLYNNIRLLTSSKDYWNWERLKIGLKMSFQRRPIIYKDCS